MGNEHIGRHYLQMSLQHSDCPIVKMSNNGASTIFDLLQRVIAMCFARWYQ
jgi:hypothetical protein